MRRKLTYFDYANMLFLMIVGFAAAYPFLNMVVISLSDGPSVAAGRVYLWPENFNLAAYRHVLTNRHFGVTRGLWNSFVYTSLGTVVSVFVTYLAAYALSRKRLIGRSFIMMFILFTMLFSGGLVPTYLLINGLGLVNTIWVMIIPTAVSVWLLIVTRAFLDGQPVELEESAFIDGANDYQIMTKIFVPLSLPVIATISLFYAVGTWNSYLYPIIYLRNPELQPITVILAKFVIKPDTSGTNQMTTQIYEQFMVYPKNMQSVIIILAMLPILLVYPFIQRYFTKGIYIGAIKG